MNTLKAGQTFRNYRELCEYLGVPYKQGAGRIKHITSLHEQFILKRFGDGIRIEEERTEPLQLLPQKPEPEILPLAVGQIYEYWTLCAQLDEPVLTGRARQIQTNTWRRYFVWKKIKELYVITEIKIETKWRKYAKSKPKSI